MAGNRSIRHRRLLAVLLVLLVSGGVIASIHIYLTYLGHEETLLSDEISISFDLLLYSSYFNLTIPAAISYIQFIFNGTEITLSSCILFDIDHVEIWSSTIDSINYSSSWIEIVPGDYLIEIETGAMKGDLIVLGRSSLPTPEEY